MKNIKTKTKASTETPFNAFIAVSFIAHFLFLAFLFPASTMENAGTPNIIVMSLYGSGTGAAKEGAPKEQQIIEEASASETESILEKSAPRPAKKPTIKAESSTDAQKTGNYGVNNYGNGNLLIGTVKGGASAGKSGSGGAEIKRYLSILNQIIQKKLYYPSSAKEHLEEGIVRLRMRIGDSGHLNSVEIITRSGSEVLDKGALKTAKQPFPPPPFGKITVEIPVRYNIRK